MKTNACLFAVAIAVASVAFAEPLAIVVHKDSGITASSQQDLGRFFLGQEKEFAGKRASPFVVGEQGSRADVVARLSGKTAAAVGDHFVKMELRAEGKWPGLMASASDLARRIIDSAGTPGRPAVIGCVPWSQYEGLAADQKAALVVVVVNGKKPADSGYPF